MGLSNPSKRPPSAVHDLENANGIDRSTTPRPFDERPSKSASPDSGLSDDHAASHPRDRWRDSPQGKRVHDRVPPPISRVAHKVAQWARGPQPPRRYHIKPLLEPAQTLPLRLMARLPRLARICVFICAFVLWVVLFGVLISKFAFPDNFQGFGSPVRLSCTNKLW
jgi:hypothetical protein